MTNQFSASQIILWLFVLALGITMGGGLYEVRVVMPLWGSAPPDSVIAYYQHNVAFPQFAPDQGGNFWIMVTPLATLLSIGVLISAYWTRGVHRRWRMAAAAAALTVQVATFAWFVPNIIRLLGGDVLTMSRDDVSSLANLWINLNWVRVALIMLAWLFALRAITIPSTDNELTVVQGADTVPLSSSVRQTS
jgi:hypothetical protein